MTDTDVGAEQPVFGRRLRQARKWQGMPQDKLGVAIGLDETTSSARISRYETGVHEPPIATAELLAAELKVPLAFLYCVEDDLALIILKASQMSAADRRRLIKHHEWHWPHA